QEIALRIQLLQVHPCVVQSRNCAGDRKAGGALVGIERVGAQRNELGLVVHVLATTHQHEHSCERGENETELCAIANTAPPSLRSAESLQENAWSQQV